MRRASGAAAVVVALGIGAAIMTGGPPPPATVPASGEVWFAESYDRTTFEMRNPTTTVRPNATFAMVAHVAHAVDGSEILMRMLRDGTLVRTIGPDLRWDSGELLGFTMTAPLGLGIWRYELTDLGGTVLAAGEVEVR